MSTLKVTNIQDTSGGNSLTTKQLYNGSAKAWVNFNGGTASPAVAPSIRADFNVRDITDQGTGDYTINFENALVDANYSIIGCFGTNTLNPERPGGIQLTSAYSSSSVRVFVIICTGSANTDPLKYDAPQTTISIFR